MASELPRSLDTASKFALFSVSDLKDEKLIKKQTYMETETCKLYSGVFWIFLPNFIKIDPYNFELYCFKVGAFFETQCTVYVHIMYICKHANSQDYQSDIIIIRLQHVDEWWGENHIITAHTWDTQTILLQTEQCDPKTIHRFWSVNGSFIIYASSITLQK